MNVFLNQIKFNQSFKMSKALTFFDKTYLDRFHSCGKLLHKYDIAQDQPGNKAHGSF